MQRDGTRHLASYDQRFESHHGKTCPDEPHRVWQTHAPGDNRDDNSCARRLMVWVSTVSIVPIDIAGIRRAGIRRKAASVGGFFHH